MALIDNVAYSWSMIQLKSSIIGDQGGETGLFIDCTAIKWSAKRKVENNYGLGGQPRSRGFGNVEYKASIKLPYSTQQLLSSLGKGTLLSLGQFDLIISWGNDLAESVTEETYTLKNCIFNESAMEVKQDDTSIEHEYDLNPFRIFSSTAQANNVSWSHEMYPKL